MSAVDVSFAEHVCLALIAEGVTHGWALGSLLAPDGEIGRIWSLSRPLTYRAVDGLADKKLITRRGQPTGRGRDRGALAPTNRGPQRPGLLLDSPLDHPPDGRTELLVQLGPPDPARPHPRAAPRKAASPAPPRPRPGPPPPPQKRGVQPLARPRVNHPPARRRPPRRLGAPRNPPGGAAFPPPTPPHRSNHQQGQARHAPQR